VPILTGRVSRPRVTVRYRFPERLARSVRPCARAILDLARRYPLLAYFALAYGIGAAAFLTYTPNASWLPYPPFWLVGVEGRAGDATGPSPGRRSQMGPP
jgi:hypothetical protein